MGTYRKLVPFAKVDESTRTVGGIVTAETPDKDGEICQYEGTKGYYKAWSDELSKASDGKNLGNLREMHGLSAVGAGKSLEFDDAKKQIYMTFKVVDDAAWRKVQEGVYTGFSHGGDYVKQWKDGDQRFYIARPVEVSLVDNPCLPVAHFDYVKADGAIEKRVVINKSPLTPEPAESNTMDQAQLTELTKSLGAAIDSKLEAFAKTFKPQTEKKDEPVTAADVEKAVNAALAKQLDDLTKAGRIKEAPADPNAPLTAKDFVDAMKAMFGEEKQDEPVLVSKTQDNADALKELFQKAFGNDGLKKSASNAEPTIDTVQLTGNPTKDAEILAKTVKPSEPTGAVKSFFGLQ